MYDALRYLEDGFKDFLDNIVNHGVLSGEDVMKGVARACIGQGYESLTEKQKKVIDHMMHKYFNDGECEQCCSPIPWCEMENSLDNGHLCTHCQNTWEDIEEEYKKTT